MRSFDRFDRPGEPNDAGGDGDVVREVLESHFLLERIGVADSDAALEALQTQKADLSAGEKGRFLKLMYLADLVRQAKVQAGREMDLNEDAERTRARVKELVRRLHEAHGGDSNT